MINIYYNPKLNLIGEGPYYLHNTNVTTYILVIKEIIGGGVETINITNFWLKDWVYLGPLR